MKKIAYRIIQNARATVFYPSEKRVTNLDGIDSPLLKRRVPKRPQQNPELPKAKEQTSSAEQTEHKKAAKL